MAQDQLTLGLRLMMSVSAAAKLLEVTPQHVRALWRRGSIQGSREAGSLVLDQESVLEYRKRRGVWNRYGVVGGNQALQRMGMQFPKGGER